jgi:ubiquinone/menaquinone biosynthesis C-methylase UbiE/uncharacterized protein YbaR (Trm112 family)
VQILSRAYPISLLPSLRELAFVCPLCRGGLDVLSDAYHCSACKKSYPLHGGIPDFRVFPDPYLDYREDYERTEIVIEALPRYELEALLEYYWSFSDITPEALRPKFIRSAMLGERKSRRTMEVLESERPRGESLRVLEVGSGTGSFLAAAMQRYKHVVGIDIAMRWLHVSRRRFMDKGLPVPPLVCCCAEYLPFPDHSFDLGVMSATLEFTRDQGKVLSECARALTSTGVLYVNTVNRYSLARDPYAYLWGIGWLPRRWQARYAGWRRGASYENINLLSYAGLHRLASDSFASVEMILPEVDEAALQQFSRATQLQGRTYRVVKDRPLFKALLTRVGPGWEAKLRKSPANG